MIRLYFIVAIAILFIGIGVSSTMKIPWRRRAMNILVLSAFWPIFILELADVCRIPGAERLLMRAERRAGL